MTPDVLLAVDLGASAYKAVIGTAERPSDFASLVFSAMIATPAAHSIRLPSLPGTRRAARPVEIAFDGQRYLAGSGAHLYGTLLDSYSFSRFRGMPDVKALFMALLTQAHEQGMLAENNIDQLEDDDTQHAAPDAESSQDKHPTALEAQSLVVGLPLECWGEQSSIPAAAKEWLQKPLSWQARLESGEKQYSFRALQVRVLPQAVGALYDFALDFDQNGKIQVVHHIGNLRVGIISLGFNTVDLISIEQGQPNERMASSQQHGVRLLLSEYDRDGRYHLSELEHMLRQGDLSPSKLAPLIPAWLRRIDGQIDKAWGDANRLDRVIVVGGAVAIPIVAQHFRARFGDNRTVIPSTPDHAVMSIAQGLYKLAAYQYQAARKT